MFSFLSSVLPTIAQVSPFNQAVKLGFDLLGQKASKEIGGPQYKSQLPATAPPISIRNTDITNNNPPNVAVCPPKVPRRYPPSNSGFNNFGNRLENRSTSDSSVGPEPMTNSGTEIQTQTENSTAEIGTQTSDVPFSTRSHLRASENRVPRQPRTTWQPRGDPPPYQFLDPSTIQNTNMDALAPNKRILAWGVIFSLLWRSL